MRGVTDRPAEYQTLRQLAKAWNDCRNTKVLKVVKELKVLKVLKLKVPKVHT